MIVLTPIKVISRAVPHKTTSIVAGELTPRRQATKSVEDGASSLH
jgi:hypothetical protein